jgi:hypothetical protein
MNTACAEVTTGDTFTVPLANTGAPTVIVAYWASWDFAATGHNPADVFAKMREHGATSEETSTIPKTAVSGDVGGLDVMVFVSAEWSTTEVLALLDMTVLDTGDV